MSSGFRAFCPAFDLIRTSRWQILTGIMYHNHSAEILWKYCGVSFILQPGPVQYLLYCHAGKPLPPLPHRIHTYSMGLAKPQPLLVLGTGGPQESNGHNGVRVCLYLGLPTYDSATLVDKR